MKEITIFIALWLNIAFLTAQPADVIMTNADQMPYFPGCNQYADGSDEKRSCSNRELVTYISDQLRYPAAAKEAAVEGTVMVSFFVDQHGKVNDPYIIRDIGHGCGEEAIKVVRGMPLWQAAVHESQSVKVKLTLPVRFSFKNTVVDETADYSLRWGRLNGKTLSKDQLEAAFESNEKIFVWDASGKKAPINELVFSFERKNTYHEKTSQGEITKDLKKIIKKVKKGGMFTITAVVQEGSKFVYVRKTFEITG